MLPAFHADESWLSLRQEIQAAAANVSLAAANVSLAAAANVSLAAPDAAEIVFMSALPAETVTFLFTDIEGSARLWEAHPDAMSAALARHDALMRTAIEARAGHVFKTMGDAFCAAFHTAPDALSAALSAQEALHAEIWPEPAIIKVRMALYSGPAEARDGDYFGQSLNRVSRLLNAGHGGQTLLSQTTEELTRDALPPLVTLLNMGEHRLRDLSQPETIFQAQRPALPAVFPPLKSLNMPNNLPLQLTSFIGRAKEMADVKNLLDTTRLLTLTGGGGGGKTRLSLEVAADALEHFPDGVWLAELAPLSDAALVPQTVASVLRLPERTGQTITQTLTDHLKEKKLLLLLDNCEHLLTACAHLTEALLRSCPNVKILASSREGLGIAGEQTYRVPSLSLPDLRQPVTVESVGQYEAARLFIDRALLSKTEFSVTRQNAAALASVCHRLDGIPLAIELAAARVRSLAVEEINVRLDNRFRLLTGGSKTALPRQQTLRAAMDWSYDLLKMQERLMLARLSVFVGGWTLEAAENVCAGESSLGEGIEDWEALDLLTSLVDKSLVVAETQAGATRYRLLETVREYACDLLTRSEKLQAVSAKQRDYFLTLAEEARPKLRGAEQAHWLALLEEEHDNLRQALTFCLEEPDGGESGLRLGAALQQFWITRGHLNEGRESLSLALAHPAAQDYTKSRAEALNGAGVLAYRQGDYPAARSLHQESLEIRLELGDRQGMAASYGNLGNVAFEQGDYAQARALQEKRLEIGRELGDRQGNAASLGNLGNVAYKQGDYALAQTRFEESLALQRETGDKRGIAISLLNLGLLAYEQGDYTAARALYGESLAMKRESGDRQGIAISLFNLGSIASDQGDYALAHSLQEESLSLRRELGDRQGVAASLGNLGLLACRQADYDLARSLQKESLSLRREIGDRHGMAGSLEALASLALLENNAERAARLWGAASRLREVLGAPLPPHVRERYAGETSAAREALTPADFAACWEAGRALTLEQAANDALEEPPASR